MARATAGAGAWTPAAGMTRAGQQLAADRTAADGHPVDVDVHGDPVRPVGPGRDDVRGPAGPLAALGRTAPISCSRPSAQSSATSAPTVDRFSAEPDA